MKDPHMHDLGQSCWLYLPENKQGFIQMGVHRVEFTTEQWERMGEIMKDTGRAA